MRVKFQDEEEFLPSVSTGKYIVVTQHFDNPVIDNIDKEPAFVLPYSYQYQTLQVPPTLKSPSRMNRPQQFFTTYGFDQPSLAEMTPKSILRKSSYPVTSLSNTKRSLTERNIRAFDSSLRYDAFSKSFDIPDVSLDKTVVKDKPANQQKPSTSTQSCDHNHHVGSCHLNINNRVIPDLEYYWTDSDSETLFTAPQSPSSIISNYLDAENSPPPVDGSQRNSCSTNDSKSRLSLFAISSLDSNDNIKSMPTPSPEYQTPCANFTFVEIHKAPDNLDNKFASIDLNTDNQVVGHKESASCSAPKEHVIDFSSEESKGNDETDFDSSLLESLTEYSEPILVDQTPLRNNRTDHFSDMSSSSKYVTVNISDESSGKDSFTLSSGSNMVTCRSEDSLNEIPATILTYSQDQPYNNNCCPL